MYKLSPEAAKTLELSIAHWEANVAAEEPKDASIDSADCALCVVYARGGCGGCPVKETVNASCCELTPYDAAFQAWDNWAIRGVPGVRREELKAIWTKAAQAELDFLKGLRNGV